MTMSFITDSVIYRFNWGRDERAIAAAYASAKCNQFNSFVTQRKPGSTDVDETNRTLSALRAVNRPLGEAGEENLGRPFTPAVFVGARLPLRTNGHTNFC